MRKEPKVRSVHVLIDLFFVGVFVVGFIWLSRLIHP